MMVRPGIARLCAAAGLVVVAAAPVAAQTQEEDLAAMYTATAKYADPQAALDAGYIDPEGMCVSAPMAGLPPETGAMGIHYIHPTLLGVDMATPMARVTGAEGTIDWTTPEVVIYEPQADGTLKLVAVEYLVFEDAWKAANPTGTPVFYDAAFTHMADDPATEPDEAHGFAPHYELHAWTARENPSGMFSEWNPAVVCPAPTEADPHAAHTANE